LADRKNIFTRDCPARWTWLKVVSLVKEGKLFFCCRVELRHESGTKIGLYFHRKPDQIEYLYEEIITRVRVEIRCGPDYYSV
jgi:hypothetical protein